MSTFFNKAEAVTVDWRRNLNIDPGRKGVGNISVSEHDRKEMMHPTEKAEMSVLSQVDRLAQPARDTKRRQGLRSGGELPKEDCDPGLMNVGACQNRKKGGES